MKLPPQVVVVFERVDALSIRERAMVAATVLAVLWALWDGLLMRPLGALEQARQDQIATMTQQVNDLNRSIQTTAAAQGQDPATAARRELAELRARIAELDGRVREVTQGLVAPQEMAALLESVLERTGNLELIEMRTLPSEPIFADGDPSGYFRHGLQVDVRGSYLDAVQYLEALERLQWSFLWQSVEIRVVDHPTSRIRIVVSTLGERAGAIRV